jgi:hypothetical protein
MPERSKGADEPKSAEERGRETRCHWLTRASNA